MGSCKISKGWSKKLDLIKRLLSLNKEQKSIIFGSLLGDGTMWLGKGGINTNFKIEHGLNQKELVFWKYEKLKNFVFTEPKISFRYTSDGTKYPKSWWFRTVRHPDLTKIYKLFYTGDGYKTGHKIVPNNDFLKKYLNPEALAVWIMDDGSFNNKIIDISTYCFSLEDIKRLQKFLGSRFSINPNFYRDRDKGCRIYFNRKETSTLIQIISPYFIDSMKYKIGFATL